jgi:AraC-like DNA-binding protein
MNRPIFRFDTQARRIRVVFVLNERQARLHAHGEVSHTEHGLTYLVEGHIEMEHGVPVTARGGSVVIMPAGVPHRPLGGRDLEVWMVGFCASCVGLDESQLLMSPFRRVRLGAMPVVPVASSRRRRLVRLYRELREEIERAAPDSQELARSLLQLLLGEVRRAMPGIEAEAPVGSLVSDALEVIQRRCFEPISLRDVAKAVHRSPTHVAATVKKATGYSVGEWITAGRVSEAAARLAHTDETVDEIAVRVGWQDTTHFIRQFRKAHGVTPAAWRREHRASHRDR